jgi:hypothetical protein
MSTHDRRGPGDKENQQTTKSFILIYVAEQAPNGEKVDYDDIELYLKQNYNLRARSGIKKHLSRLVNDGLLCGAGKLCSGVPSTYSLRDGSFGYFMRLFNFTHKASHSKQFMQTRYFLNCMESGKFRGKLAILVGKATYLQMINHVSSDKGYKQAIKDLGNTTEEYQQFGQALLNDIRDKKPHTQYSTIALQINKLLMTCDIDQLYDLIDEKYGIEKATGVFNIIMPEPDKATIINILKTSPSAMDMVLNQKDYNPSQLIATTLRYFTTGITNDKTKMGIIKQIAQIGDDLTSDMAGKYLTQLFDFSALVNEIPVVVMLKTEFNRDYQNSNLVANEYSRKAINQTYLPQIKG